MNPLQFSFEPQFGKQKLNACHYSLVSDSSQNFAFMFHRETDSIWVWNKMRVSKWWQNFHLWVNCPFKKHQGNTRESFCKKVWVLFVAIDFPFGKNGKSSHGTLGHTSVLPYISAVSSNKSFHNKHTGRTKAIQNAGIVYTSLEEHHLNMDGTNCTHPGEDG